MRDYEPYFPVVDREAEGIQGGYLASSLRLPEQVNVDITDPN